MCVADLKDDLVFAENDSELAESIRYDIRDANEFDSFFVGIEEGELTEVWGLYGDIGYGSREVYKVL